MALLKGQEQHDGILHLFLFLTSEVINPRKCVLFYRKLFKNKVRFQISVSCPSQFVTEHKDMEYSVTGYREGNPEFNIPSAWISGVYPVARLSSAVHLVINQQLFISTLNIISFCQIKHLEGPGGKKEKKKKSKFWPCPKAASEVRVKSSAASGGFYFIRAWLGWKNCTTAGEKKKKSLQLSLQAPLSLEGLDCVPSLRTSRL